MKMSIMKASRSEIVDYIIEQMESTEGHLWEMPCTESMLHSYNFKEQRPYHGANKLRLMLSAMENGFTDPRWMTFDQAKKLGYSIKKGAKSTKIEFWKPVEENKEKVDEKSNPIDKAIAEQKKKPEFIFTYYDVFNGEQIEGLEPYNERDFTRTEEQNIQELDTILAHSEAPIEYTNPEGNMYIPKEDIISLRPEKAFKSRSHLYATALHEIAHSTGHESRLNRENFNLDGLSDEERKKEYAREELVAEFTAAMLNAKYNLPFSEVYKDNHASYVKSWHKLVKDDPKELFRAVKKADEAMQYIEERMLQPYLEKSEEQEVEVSNARDIILVLENPHTKELEAYETDKYLIKKELEYAPLFPTQKLPSNTSRFGVPVYLPGIEIQGTITNALYDKIKNNRTLYIRVRKDVEKSIISQINESNKKLENDPFKNLKIHFHHSQGEHVIGKDIPGKTPPKAYIGPIIDGYAIPNDTGLKGMEAYKFLQRLAIHDKLENTAKEACKFDLYYDENPFHVINRTYILGGFKPNNGVEPYQEINSDKPLEAIYESQVFLDSKEYYYSGLRDLAEAEKKAIEQGLVSTAEFEKYKNLKSVAVIVNRPNAQGVMEKHGYELEPSALLHLRLSEAMPVLSHDGKTTIPCYNCNPEDEHKLEMLMNNFIHKNQLAIHREDLSQLMQQANQKEDPFKDLVIQYHFSEGISTRNEDNTSSDFIGPLSDNYQIKEGTILKGMEAYKLLQQMAKHDQLKDLGYNKCEISILREDGEWGKHRIDLGDGIISTTPYPLHLLQDNYPNFGISDSLLVAENNAIKQGLVSTTEFDKLKALTTIAVAYEKDTDNGKEQHCYEISSEMLLKIQGLTEKKSIPSIDGKHTIPSYTIASTEVEYLEHKLNSIKDFNELYINKESKLPLFSRDDIAKLILEDGVKTVTQDNKKEFTKQMVDNLGIKIKFAEAVTIDNEIPLGASLSAFSSTSKANEYLRHRIENTAEKEGIEYNEAHRKVLQELGGHSYETNKLYTGMNAVSLANDLFISDTIGHLNNKGYDKMELEVTAPTMDGQTHTEEVRIDLHDGKLNNTSAKCYAIEDLLNITPNVDKEVVNTIRGGIGMNYNHLTENKQQTLDNLDSNLFKAVSLMNTLDGKYGENKLSPQGMEAFVEAHNVSNSKGFQEAVQNWQEMTDDKLYEYLGHDQVKVQVEEKVDTLSNKPIPPFHQKTPNSAPEDEFFTPYYQEPVKVAKTTPTATQEPPKVQEVAKEAEPPKRKTIKRTITFHTRKADSNQKDRGR